MLSGELKQIECIGSVEIKTPTHVVLCDRCTFDMKQNVMYMEMKNSKDNVRVFIKGGPDGAGNALVSRKSMAYNMVSQEIKTPHGWTSVALPDPIPTNRPAPK